MAEADEGGAEREAMERMMDRSLDDVFRAGHEALLRRLVAKCIAGTASHQELAILRNLLRDNGMTMDYEATKTIEPLQDAIGFGMPLPELPAPDYDE